MAVGERADRLRVDAVAAARAASPYAADEAAVRIAPDREAVAGCGQRVERPVAGQLALQLQLGDADAAGGQKHRERRRLAVVAQRLLHDRNRHVSLARGRARRRERGASGSGLLASSHAGGRYRGYRRGRGDGCGRAKPEVPGQARPVAAGCVRLVARHRQRQRTGACGGGWTATTSL